jgi:hypothetical protein
MSKYVVRKGAIWGPKKVVTRQGEVLPDGFGVEDIEGWLASGKIEAVQAGPAPSPAPRGRSRGQWRYDPSALIDKDMEALLQLVVSQDDSVDLSKLGTPGDVIAFLCRDWSPDDRQAPAKVVDKSSPAAKAVGVSDSDAAEAKIAEARRRAGADKAEAEKAASECED